MDFVDLTLDSILKLIIFLIAEKLSKLSHGFQI